MVDGRQSNRKGASICSEVGSGLRQVGRWPPYPIGKTPARSRDVVRWTETVGFKYYDGQQRR
jgi:hypothetical protein